MAKLPGFVGVEHAVTAKSDALARMEEVNILQVVDDWQRFVGPSSALNWLRVLYLLAVAEKLESR